MNLLKLLTLLSAVSLIIIFTFPEDECSKSTEVDSKLLIESFKKGWGAGSNAAAKACSTSINDNSEIGVQMLLMQYHLDTTYFIDKLEEAN